MTLGHVVGEEGGERTLVFSSFFFLDTYIVGRKVDLYFDVNNMQNHVKRVLLSYEIKTFILNDYSLVFIKNFHLENLI